MKLDTIESKTFINAGYDSFEHLKNLHKGFDTKVKALDGSFEKFDDVAKQNAMQWLDRTNVKEIDMPTVYDQMKDMYNGSTQKLGLKEIGNWKINKEFSDINIKQQSGFAAEVAGTAKENINAMLDKTGIKTFRADDRPDLFVKNDQYVDKIRVDQSGNILERIQVKFVGKDPESCLSKLTSKKYDKYFNDGKVDKMEIPKNYYDDIKNQLIPERLEKLGKQLDRANLNGNNELAEKIQSKINRLNKVDQMIEKSTVSTREAIFARRHPKLYTSKIFTEKIARAGNSEGLKSGGEAMALTAVVSTVDNVQKVMAHEITPQDAAFDVGKDGLTAGAIGYGTGFISKATTEAMSASGHHLLRAAGKAGVPAAIITFGVESIDDISQFSQGEIDSQQFAVNLSKNAVSVGGGAIGTAVAGAAVGSVVPGAGTAVGFGAGLVGGLVGTVICSEAYDTALENAPEMADALANKAQSMANQTIETTKKFAPEKLDTIKSALNDYITINDLPITI